MGSAVLQTFNSTFQRRKSSTLLSEKGAKTSLCDGVEDLHICEDTISSGFHCPREKNQEEFPLVQL